MNLNKLFLINNNCYIVGNTLNPTGIMIHSTGANNPALKRYVGPDDGLLGINTGNNHWNRDLPDGREVCVHAFIGKLKDGTIASYQTLPWNMRGWHCGGKANDTHIGIEICEDALTDKNYFMAVYQEAVELCAYLCKLYNIKPEKPSVICHSEGRALGLASNHSDVMHWFPKFGKSMDTFRAEVAKALSQTAGTQQTAAGATVAKETPILSAPTATEEQARQWAKGKGATEQFVMLASLYWKYIVDCRKVNPVVAYCQAAKETRYGKFGGVIDASYCNPCGMKTEKGGGDTEPNAHMRFENWGFGVLAHLDHLGIYAGAPGYPLSVSTHDPRHFPYLLGKAKTVEALGGQWAPSQSYGTEIVSMMRELEGTKVTVAQPGNSAVGNDGAPDGRAVLTKEVENAIDTAVKHGVIASPDYWVNAVKDGKLEYLGQLFVNFGKPLDRLQESVGK
jgi:hypothetical protein